MTPPLRLAVLADIHGNLPALEAVLADARERGAGSFLVCGDLVNGAPYPAETLARLLDLDALIIQGNAEERLLQYHRGQPGFDGSPRWGTLRFTHRRLGRDALEAVAALPEQAVFAPPGADAIQLVHGSPGGISKALVPDRHPAALAQFRAARLWPEDRQPPALEEALGERCEPGLVCGHTHIPWRQALAGGGWVLNPGSVGMPNHGDPRACYALLAWGGAGEWQAEHRVVDYDREALRQAFHASGLLEEGGAFARACLANIQIGVSVPWFLVLHAAELEGQDPAAGPDSAWERAAQTFPWERYE